MKGPSSNKLTAEGVERDVWSSEPERGQLKRKGGSGPLPRIHYISKQHHHLLHVQGASGQ